MKTITKPIGIVTLLALIAASFVLQADTVILRKGRPIKNVKTYVKRKVVIVGTVAVSGVASSAGIFVRY